MSRAMTLKTSLKTVRVAIGAAVKALCTSTGSGGSDAEVFVPATPVAILAGSHTYGDLVRGTSAAEAFPMSKLGSRRSRARSRGASTLEIVFSSAAFLACVIVPTMKAMSEAGERVAAQSEHGQAVMLSPSH